jgi:phage terminase small subunit
MAGRQGAADRHRRFVDAYAASGCVNATAAARAAGYTGREAALAVTASRLLRIAKVRDAIRELSGEAIAKANSERAGAIADLAEALEFVTTTMRSRPGEHLGLSAAQTLIKHYQDTGEGKREPGLLAEALKQQPPEVIRSIVRAMLAGRRRAIDVGAKVVP